MKRVFWAIVLSLLTFHLPHSAVAAFRDPGYGARPAGMGNAFTAVSDDVNAVLFNPAGATQAGSRQLALTYSKPFAGLDDVSLHGNFFSAVLPVSDVATFGLGWTSFAAPVYRQNSVSLLAATSINRWVPKLGPALSAGANLRFLHHRFDTDPRTAGDSVFSGGISEAAVAVDVGLLGKPDPDVLPGLTLGLRAMSLNQPDIGLEDVDKVPRELVAGAAFNRRSLTLTFDLARRDDRTDWRAGAEYWMRDETLGVRAGAHSTAATAGFSVLFPAWRKTGLFLDYAFSLPLYIDDTAGSHRAALGVLF
jgi:hypothetical protein